MRYPHTPARRRRGDRVVLSVVEPEGGVLAAVPLPRLPLHARVAVLGRGGFLGRDRHDGGQQVRRGLARGEVGLNLNECGQIEL